MYREHAMPIFLAGDVLGKNDKSSQASHNKYFLEKMGVKSADIFIIPKGRDTETEVQALVSILNGRYIPVINEDA